MEIYLALKLDVEAKLGSYARQFNLVIMRVYFMHGEYQYELMLTINLISFEKVNRPISSSGNDRFQVSQIYVREPKRFEIGSLAII